MYTNNQGRIQDFWKERSYDKGVEGRELALLIYLIFLKYPMKMK